MKLVTLELTLSIIKPDAVSRPHIFEAIRGILLRENFKFVRSRKLLLTREKAEDFYKEHEGRFFHNRLVTFMSSGPVVCQVLARHDAVRYWRDLMGPTKVYRAQHSEPGSIRGMYGLTDTRNSTHGSDSKETAQKEILFFFPDLDQKKWYREEEALFRDGLVEYNSDLNVHTVIRSV